jgi:hypothetical protein
MARLVASAATTAGDSCTIAVGESSKGGAMAASRSASRAMAASPELATAACRAFALMWIIAPLQGNFLTLANPRRDAAFSANHG